MYTLTEPERTEFLAALRRCTDEQLLEGLAEFLEKAETTSTALGVEPDLVLAAVPNANFIISEMHELHLRRHDYFDQGDFLEQENAA